MKILNEVKFNYELVNNFRMIVIHRHKISKDVTVFLSKDFPSETIYKRDSIKKNIKIQKSMKSLVTFYD